MTKLKELKGLLEKATPGPWAYSAHVWIVVPASPSPYGDLRVVATFGDKRRDEFEGVNADEADEGARRASRNAKLVVWLVNNAPALISAQAAEIARLKAVVTAAHKIWSDAEDAADARGFVEDHIIRGVASYTDNLFDARPRDLLCDFVEKLGRKARAALQSSPDRMGEA